MSKPALRALALAIVLFAPALPATTQDEASLRAAMVYNLMLFVDWPEGSRPPAGELLLCFVSDDTATARAFTGLAGKTVKGRALQVQYRGALAALDCCRAVYFDRLQPNLLADKLARLKGLPVLTLAEPSAVPSGAMIDILLDGNHLAFEIGNGALRAGGLSLGARVMQLARAVRP